jgi:hypothetical protein
MYRLGQPAALTPRSLGAFCFDNSKGDVTMSNKVAMQVAILAFLVDTEKKIAKIESDRAVLIADIAKCVLAHKTLEAQWTWVSENVAPALAKHYKATARETRNGTITFDNPDGTRHDAALSALRSLLSGTTLLAGAGNTNRNKKEKDPVADLLKQFNALTAKQKKQFLASV